MIRGYANKADGFREEESPAAIFPVTSPPAEGCGFDSLALLECMSSPQWLRLCTLRAHVSQQKYWSVTLVIVNRLRGQVAIGLIGAGNQLKVLEVINHKLSKMLFSFFYMKVINIFITFIHWYNLGKIGEDNNNSFVGIFFNLFVWKQTETVPIVIINQTITFNLYLSAIFLFALNLSGEILHVCLFIPHSAL